MTTAGTGLVAMALLLAVAAGPHSAGGRDDGRPASYRGFGGGVSPPATWRPYAPDSPFNRRVTAADDIHPASAAIVRRALSWGPPAPLVAGNAGTKDDYDHPIYFARSTDPRVVLQPTRPWGRNPIRGQRINVPRRARPARGGDGHMTIIQPDGTEYDFWQVEPRQPSGGVLRFGWGGRTRIDGDGLGSGSTATGFGGAAGIIRAAELRAGRIEHALALVVRCTSDGLDFGSGVRPAPRGDAGSSYVFPATKGATSCGPGTPSAPPAGARFRLDLDDAAIARISAPPWKTAILRALAHYGAYVTDTGGPGFAFLAESSVSYTSFGRSDPMVRVARDAGSPKRGDRYVLKLASGVEWSKDLKVLNPPRRARMR